MIVAIVLAVALAGAFVYRFTHLATGKGAHPFGQQDAAVNNEKKESPEGVRHQEAESVRMGPEIQAKNGVQTALVGKERLTGNITATGKVEVNADRIAHVSPRISGKVVAVRSSLGEEVGTGQVLATLDSVELGEAISRYRQSRTRLSLAKNNLERVKTLVDKKIAARKEILQAETDFRTAETEQQADRERLLLYGVSAGQIESPEGRRLLLPVRSPIGGVITEKHAIVGELADPSRSLYTVADLSSVWVLVDINEKDLAKVRKGQSATVTVGAFPDLKFRGRITHVADLVDEATRTVKARVEVPNPGRKLKPEMFATVELNLPAGDPAVLAISADAVQEIDGQKVVFVTKDGRTFLPRAVRAGRASAGMVEVSGGLAEGERYAATGSFLLKSELKKGELGEEH